MTRVELLTAIVCGAVLGACAYTPRVKPTREPDGLLTGSATYREGIAIPRDAVLEVWIRDLSPLALAAPIVAETAVLAEGRQVPIPFELKYERRRIVADRSYALQAVIRDAGEILFTTGQDQLVITQGQPTEEVELLLVRPTSEIAKMTDVLEGTAWRLDDLGGAGVLDKIEATLEFAEGGKTAGQGSCNRFFGTSVASGTSIKIGPVGATLMACDEAAMNQEKRYFDALNNAERFMLDGPILQIFYKGNEKPLRFVRK
jgi:putative lipoprotein